MTKKDATKLSKLAIKTEVTLRKVLDAIARDIDQVEKAGITPQGKRKREPIYTLTDFMKVADRALKLEQIRLNAKDDAEGSFFNQSNDGEGAEDEDERTD